MLDMARERLNSACPGRQVARWRGENWRGLGLDGGDVIKAMNKACVSVCVCECVFVRQFKDFWSVLMEIGFLVV